MALTLVASNNRRYNLDSELTFGRDSTCSIPLLNDSAVSRQHARFTWLNGLPVIEDLGSRNGTFLNGARISQARPISSGDEIRIGSEIFRVEATLDAITGQVPTPTSPKEVSRGESRHQRKREQSGAEGSLYGKTGVSDWNPMSGCALPNINLSGCLKYLWIILLILIVAVVIGLIISGIATLLASAGGAASQAVSGAGTSTSTGGQGENAPPLPNQDSPPPPNNDKPQAAPSAEGIHIQEVKIDFAKRNGDSVVPVVLVKWMNLTKSPVKRITGTVRVFDRDGKLLAEIPRESIYNGPPVSPGEGHQDTIQEGGVVIRQKPPSPPASAKIIIDRVE